jgi:hypothetical protein
MQSFAATARRADYKVFNETVVTRLAPSPLSL